MEAVDARGAPATSTARNLLILGIALSLDDFEAAIVLGALQLRCRDAVRVGLVPAAPLVGILAGDYLADTIGSTADYLAAAVLGAFGLIPRSGTAH